MFAHLPALLLCADMLAALSSRMSLDILGHVEGNAGRRRFHRLMPDVSLPANQARQTALAAFGGRHSICCQNQGHPTLLRCLRWPSLAKRWASSRTR